MFTGIIEAFGIVHSIEKQGTNTHFGFLHLFPTN